MKTEEHKYGWEDKDNKKTFFVTVGHYKRRQFYSNAAKMIKLGTFYLHIS